MAIKYYTTKLRYFLLRKEKFQKKITLVDDNDTIVSGNQSISEELNTFIKDVMKILNKRQTSHKTDESNESKETR